MRLLIVCAPRCLGLVHLVSSPLLVFSPEYQHLPTIWDPAHSDACSLRADLDPLLITKSQHSPTKLTNRLSLFITVIHRLFGSRFFAPVHLLSGPIWITARISSFNQPNICCTCYFPTRLPVTRSHTSFQLVIWLSIQSQQPQVITGSVR